MLQTLILVIDDSKTSQAMTLLYLEQAGYHCSGLDSGEEALAFCENTRPDLILMDIGLPGIDGMETTRQLRIHYGDYWVPIIYLTGSHNDQDLLDGLKAGGDDYLTKPINYQLLHAKIQVFLRISSMQRQIALDAVRLAQYYEENEFEQSLALELIQRLTYRSFVGQSHIWYRLNPADIFNGDVICRSSTAPNIEHFLLADCTGHGLTAAISALPVIDGFYEMVRQYLSTRLLASGINKKLHSLLPTGRFVVAGLCSIDYSNQTLELWNGGLPCALLVGAGGKIRQTFISRHPPLGILDETAFDPTLITASWQNGDYLVMSSDGITEANNAEGIPFDLDGVKQAILKGWPDQIGPMILQSLQQHLGGDIAKDDLSLLIVKLGEHKVQNSTA